MILAQDKRRGGGLALVAAAPDGPAMPAGSARGAAGWADDRPSRFPSAGSVALDVASVIQVPALGLALIPLHHMTMAKTAATGLVVWLVSVLIAVALRGLPAPGHAGPAVRAVHAGFAVASAFALMVIQAFSDPGGTGPAVILLWGALSSLAAAALAYARPTATDIAVVGPPAAAEALARRLHPMPATQLAAVLDPADPTHLARLDALVERRPGIRILLPAASPRPQIEAVCLRLSGTLAQVQLEALPARAMNLPFSAARADTQAMGHVVDLLPAPISGWHGAVKRVLDLLVVLAALPLLAPMLLLIALAIRLESPGPALFRQWRFGQGGRPFLVYKFRTMRAVQSDASGAARTLARDPRVTHLGRVLRRLSIDELPQLWNVLKGDMSIVGPRPHAVAMHVGGTPYLDAVEVYRARHRVKPGVTGWAQINGSRGEVDTLDKAERRVELDLWYIAHWSPALDVWIIARTLFGGFTSLHAD